MSGIDTGMISRANELQNRFSSLTPAPNVFRFGTPDGTNAAFPVQLGSTDPEDKKYQLREKLVTGPGASIPGVGQAVADDQFFDYAKRKEEQAVLYDFYRFMFSQADLTKPESANWWFSKFPWMRDLRLEEINKNADLQKTLARIQVTGPETEDDFMLMYLIRNGTIVPPQGALWQMGANQGPKVASTFKEGFFSRLVSASIFNDQTGGVFNSPPGPLGAVPTGNMGVKWNHPVPALPANGVYNADYFNGAYGGQKPSTYGNNGVSSMRNMFGWANLPGA